ncbi:hypothetical protein ACJX0J_029888, partial [Zea mays]
ENLNSVVIESSLVMEIFSFDKITMFPTTIKDIFVWNYNLLSICFRTQTHFFTGFGCFTSMKNNIFKLISIHIQRVFWIFIPVWRAIDFIFIFIFIFAILGFYL